MAAQRGRELLLKIDGDGQGTYTTVAGLRSRTLAFNAQTVDVTHAESSGQWRELLSGAGIKTARVSGAGVFKDAASDDIIRGAFFGGDILSWQLIIPDFGVVTGPFQISAFELTGSHEAEITFELSLESAGSLMFAAA